MRHCCKYEAMMKVVYRRCLALGMVAAILAISVSEGSLALAESDGVSVTYIAPILSVWRDPGAFLVLATDYGNFYYTYQDDIKSIDGTKTYRLIDRGTVLLKAILAHNDGMPVRLRVSTLAQGVVVGLNEVTAYLEPVSFKKPAEQDQ